MKLRKPPDESPDLLFLRAIAWPSTPAPLEFRFSVSPTEKLFATAVPGQDFLSIAHSGRPGDMTAACLRDASGKKVFDSGRTVERVLSASEVRTLEKEIFERLPDYSPMYRLVDHNTWGRVLQAGAASLWYIASRLAMSVDVSYGPNVVTTIPRLDRFFGCATRELLDCHWMAFNASREIYERKHG